MWGLCIAGCSPSADNRAGDGARPAQPAVSDASGGEVTELADAASSQVSPEPPGELVEPQATPLAGDGAAAPPLVPELLPAPDLPEAAPIGNAAAPLAETAVTPAPSPETPATNASAPPSEAVATDLMDPAGDPPSEAQAIQGVAPEAEAAPAAQVASNPLRREAAFTTPALPAKRPSKKDAPFDPIKENGPIFDKWPKTKPTLALVLTGRQDGYLEPCGCAGLNRMKGGLTRRHTMFRQLREQYGWPLIGLDAGGQIKGYGLQTEMKFHTTVEAMRTMGYNAIALGANDLRLPAAEVAADAAPLPDQPALFLSANAALFGFAADMTAKSEVYEAGGVKVGVTAVVGTKWRSDVNNQEIEFEDAEAALAEIVPQLKAKADVLVLLAHATVEESTALAQKFPDFDLIVTAGGPPEPPLAPTQIGKKTLLIETGEKGMYAVVLGLFEEPSRRFEYQRVPLDSRFASSPDMQLLMANYQDRLRETGLEGLGIHPSPHPEKLTKGSFVGSKSCESCHEPSYKLWKKSGHAKAWPTLVNLDPPRNYDPECISCHVVGWHPTNYFPYESGFLSEAETPHLIDVGCESCHGPGEKHVKAEEHATPEAIREQLRKAMVITKEESEKHQCMSCHDGDNSPDFDFKTYWPFVEHSEN